MQDELDSPTYSRIEDPKGLMIIIGRMLTFFVFYIDSPIAAISRYSTANGSVASIAKSKCSYKPPIADESIRTPAESQKGILNDLG